MLVIPAIDLKDGLCVRLKQGRKEDVTTYSNDPVETAGKWVSAGAQLIHIVDLDGAFTGQQKNLESVRKIRKAVDVPLELGGGIRSMEHVDMLIAIGVNRLILGTVAVKNPDLLKRAAGKYPGKILVGIDAKDGKVAIKGWEEVTTLDAIKLARDMEAAGAASVIYTDISRDGMMTGVNMNAMADMVKSVSIPVIASGGVSTLDDIRSLMSIENLYGAITGKAIYSGAIDLKEAIAITKSV